MKVMVGEEGTLEITEVYNGIELKTSDPKESLGICMRDGGYEFNYYGKSYRMIGGEIIELKKSKEEYKFNPSLG